VGRRIHLKISSVNLLCIFKTSNKDYNYLLTSQPIKIMQDIFVYLCPFLENDEYHTPGDLKMPFFFNRRAYFMRKFSTLIYRNGLKARQGEYEGVDWANCSYGIFHALEQVGLKFHLYGIRKIAALKGPVVFCGNHMSVLETVVLPMLIQPFRDVNFVIKKELLQYPYFKDIMVARNSIIVERGNPRKDLAVVLKEGRAHLKNGTSIILFPQARREFIFDPANYNSLAVKLAKRSNVPLVPVALVTDAWQNGKLVKDFGPLKTDKAVNFAFGDPIDVFQHPDPMSVVTDFIQSHFREWGREDLLVGNGHE